MAHSPLTKIQSRVIYRNPWIRLEEHDVEVRATGRRIKYSYLCSRPSVMVVAMTEKGEIVLIRQYRYPTRRFSYELPGGGSGKLAPREAARTELRQETGYRARRLRKLGEFVVYCGLSDEICHVYLALGLKAGPTDHEEAEHIAPILVTYPRLEAMIRGGEFCDGMGLAALNLARESIEQELAKGGR